MIKLESIEFEEIPFRKFKKIKMNIAKRITVIAGHNGIGKSTLLGILTNASAYISAKHKTYFDKNYKSSIEEVFYLSPDSDFENDPKKKPNFIITYNDNGNKIQKKCNISDNNDGKRLRIHPRTLIEKNGKTTTGSAAKIPIPTIYVGMSRMYPIGENEDDQIERPSHRMHPDDIVFSNECFQEIFSIKIEDTSKISAYNIKDVKKKSKVADLGHDPLCISLGQDSISIILQALASFNKLKRDLGDEYPGGILAIDELEAGLHPRAQIKLITVLKKRCKNLDLQLLVTTHSLTIIKEIIKDPENKMDTVNYLMNSDNPIILTDASYLKIKNDMLSNPFLGEKSNPIIKFYFEDEEAIFFFEKILKHLKLNLEEKYGINVELINTKLGCEQLFHLSEADSEFSSTVIVFDNDVMSSELSRQKINNNKNFISLPSDSSFDANTRSVLRNPEAIVFNFLKKLSDNVDSYEDFWYSSSSLGFSTDSIREIHHKFIENNYDREKNKPFFNTYKHYFDRVEIIQYWCKENKSEVNKMADALDKAIKYCDFVKHGPKTGLARSN